MESNSQLSVELVTPEKHDDDTVCDAARVSFAKRADQFSPEKNKRLRRFLFNPSDGPVPHWAPFAMPRICLRLSWSSYSMDIIDFLAAANLAGFSWKQDSPSYDLGTINGSLWAWYENLPYLPMGEAVRNTLVGLYPDCAEIFGWEADASGETLTVVEDETHPDLAYESVRIRSPIFVARQLVKHQRHMVWSEESRRYIDSVPELYIPDKFHKRPDKSIKQGASSTLFDDDDLLRDTISHAEGAVDLYQYLIKSGMAPEEARMFLPLNTMTEWIWTGSLRAFQRVATERLAKPAQGATRDAVALIDEALVGKYGSAWRQQ